MVAPSGSCVVTVRSGSECCHVAFSKKSKPECTEVVMEYASCDCLCKCTDSRAFIASQRVTPTLRKYTVREAIMSNQAKNAAEAARSIGGNSYDNQRFIVRELSALRCEMLLSFRESETLSFTTDGIRFGNPGKEYLMTAVMDLDTHASATLTPKVRSIIHFLAWL